jgi:excisionase family DNA binding protein
VGKSGEFFTFDEVLSKLDIDETKLKRLVSEGEIRAFREGDEMKFRRSDVENLDVVGAHSEEETGVIDLSAGSDSSETLTDDLIFDEGDDLDLSADAGMATAEISSQDTLVDEEIGMSTEPLGIDAGDMTDVVEPDDDVPMMTASKSRRPDRQPVAEEQPSDIVWALVMTVTAVFMILGAIVVLGIRDSATGATQAADMAKQLATTFGSAITPN